MVSPDAIYSPATRQPNRPYSMTTATSLIVGAAMRKEVGDKTSRMENKLPLSPNTEAGAVAQCDYHVRSRQRLSYSFNSAETRRAMSSRAERNTAVTWSSVPIAWAGSGKPR